MECTPRRSHADQHVARAHVAWSCGRTLPRSDRADRKSGEVEIALGIEPRHLRRLAADQGAADSLAGTRDAFDHGRRVVDVQLAAGVVVEEEQRLGALHDDVVDAHRDQVLADAGEEARVDGDLELGADAVGRGDQHRILVSRAAFRSNRPPKPPRSASAPGRRVALAAGAMRATSASPASMSTPASL